MKKFKIKTSLEIFNLVSDSKQQNCKVNTPVELRTILENNLKDKYDNADVEVYVSGKKAEYIINVENKGEHRYTYLEFDFSSPENLQIIFFGKKYDCQKIIGIDGLVEFAKALRKRLNKQLTPKY